MHYFVSFLVLQSSDLVTLLYLSSQCIVTLRVLWLFSFSRCRELVCSVRLWYFLIILTCFFEWLLKTCFTVRRGARRRPGNLGFNIIMDLDARHPDLLLADNKGADQPTHPRNLISTFVSRYLKSKATRSDIS